MNIRTITLAELTTDQRREILQRSAVPDVDMRRAATEIVESVRHGGDQALVAANVKYGGGAVDSVLRVEVAALKNALNTLHPSVRTALKKASRNIRRAHAPPPRTRPWKPSPASGLIADGHRCAESGSMSPAVGPHTPRVS